MVAKSFYTHGTMAGIGLSVQVECIEMDKIRMHVLNGEADDLLEVIEIILILETGAISIGLLEPIGEHDGPACGIPLHPVGRLWLLGKKRFIHHGVPLYVDVNFHAEAVGEYCGPDGVAHLVHLRRHAEALIQMRMKDLDSGIMQAANRLLILRFLVIFPRIKALAAAPYHEQIWLMRPSTVDDSVFDPLRARH